MTGDWDGAEAELAQAADADGLAGLTRSWRATEALVAALRGEAPAAQAALAGLVPLRVSEDPQDQAFIAVAEAFTAAALGQPAAALRHARAALDHAAALGMSRRGPAVGLAAGRPRRARPGRHRHRNRRCWPCWTATQPGSWPPCSAPNGTWPAPAWPPVGGDPDSGPAFAAAIAGLRQHSTPTTWPTACSTTLAT